MLGLPAPPDEYSWSVCAQCVCRVGNELCLRGVSLSGLCIYWVVVGLSCCPLPPKPWHCVHGVVAEQELLQEHVMVEQIS